MRTALAGTTGTDSITTARLLGWAGQPPRSGSFWYHLLGRVRSKTEAKIILACGAGKGGLNGEGGGKEECRDIFWSRHKGSRSARKLQSTAVHFPTDASSLRGKIKSEQHSTTFKNTKSGTKTWRIMFLTNSCFARENWEELRSSISASSKFDKNTLQKIGALHPQDRPFSSPR